MSLKITKELTTKWNEKFHSSEKTKIAQNFCTVYNPLRVNGNDTQLNSNTLMCYKVEPEGKPYSDQRNANCSWLYAGLNIIRTPFMKAQKLDEFEFSHAYLLYWHKIERSNFFLNTVVHLIKDVGEKLDGRLLRHLFKQPVPDAGQWICLVNLIRKYGLMPKQCYLTSVSATNTKHMNAILRAKLREYACELNTMVTKFTIDTASVAKRLEEMLAEVHKIISICLGIPQETFIWEYYNKSKQAYTIGPITPLDFYEKYVKPHINVEEWVCLGCDPRQNHPYDAYYISEYTSNMIEGLSYSYINLPIDGLHTIAVESIKAGKAVWCGVDSMKRFRVGSSELRLDVHNFQLVFEINSSDLTKEERLLYQDSRKNHGLVLTAVCTDESIMRGVTSAPISTVNGAKKTVKNYTVTMWQNWFNEYVFEIVVHKSFVPSEMLSFKNPKQIPIWDPMAGNLS